MLLTSTVRTSRLKSEKWLPNMDAVAHLPERQWHEEPRRVVPIRPGPGRDAEDVAAAVFRLEPVVWEAPEDFWKLSLDDAAVLVIDAIHDEIRRRKRAALREQMALTLRSAKPKLAACSPRRRLGLSPCENRARWIQFSGYFFASQCSHVLCYCTVSSTIRMLARI